MDNVIQVFATAIIENPDEKLGENSKASTEDPLGFGTSSIEGPKRKFRKERKRKQSRGEQDEHSIGSMIAECSRISDLTQRENECVEEIALSLRTVIDSLDSPIHFNPTLLMNLDKCISDAMLTSQGTICTVDDKGITSTVRIEDIPADSLINILEEIIPHVRKQVIDKDRGAKHRISSLASVPKTVKRLLSRV